MFVVTFADITEKYISITCTSLTFQLQSRMADIVFMGQYFVQVTLDRCSCADMDVVSDDMGGERSQALVDAPHMQVVDSLHAVHFQKVSYH